MPASTPALSGPPIRAACLALLCLAACTGMPATSGTSSPPVVAAAGEEPVHPLPAEPEPADFEPGDWWYRLDMVETGEPAGYKRLVVTRDGELTLVHSHTRQVRDTEISKLDQWMSFGKGRELLAYTADAADAPSPTVARRIGDRMRVAFPSGVVEVQAPRSLIPAAAEALLARHVPRRVGGRLSVQAMRDGEGDLEPAGYYYCVGRQNLGSVETTGRQEVYAWLIHRMRDDKVQASYWVDDFGRLVASVEQQVRSRLVTREEALAELPVMVRSPYAPDTPHPGLLRQIKEIRILAGQVEEAAASYGRFMQADTGDMNPARMVFRTAGGTPVAILSAADHGASPSVQVVFEVHDLSRTLEALRGAGLDPEVLASPDPDRPPTVHLDDAWGNRIVVEETQHPATQAVDPLLRDTSAPR